MSLVIETKQAVAALKVAAKECGDVLAVAARPDELPQDFEGRGYAYIVSRIGDMFNVINNGLRDIGETEIVPAAPAPREIIQTERVEVEIEKVVEVVSPEAAQKIEALEADNARLQNLLDQGVQEIEEVMAENQTLKAEKADAPADVIENMEAVKEAIDSREIPFNFSLDFLDANAVDGEDRAATNRRLLSEYEELQQSKRALNHGEDKRREELRTAFYNFRG